MAKWITAYIAENEEKWRKEKLSREENEKKRYEEWARMTRLEKVRVMKEKYTESTISNVTLTAPKLTLPPGNSILSSHPSLPMMTSHPSHPNSPRMTRW